MKFLLLVFASVLSCSAISHLFLFEENRGQVPEPVRYLVRTPKLQLFLSDWETTVSLGKKPVSIVLEGADKNSRWRPEGKPSELQTDYIHGADPARWQYRIKNFHAVRRANVYPGVDQIYYSNAKRLEYDFEVKPQANPANIRLKFSTRLKLKADGSLVAGDLVQLAPVAYQLDTSGKRRNVEARWDLASANTARFVLGPYDRNQKLVIDPEIETASAIGGAGADEWVGFTRIGNTLVAAGVSESLEYPGAFGRGGRDITLVLLNANTLQPLRAVFLGGSGTDRPLAISGSPSGGVRVVGETDSRNFPIQGDRQGVPQATYGGGATDGFVLDYNFFTFSGPSLLSTYVGGSEADRVTATNNSWIAGETRSDDIPISTSGTFYKAGWDVFATSLDFRFGSVLSGAFLSGSGNERATSIAFFNNLVLVGGSTDSQDLPVQNAFQSNLAGGRDGFFWSFALSAFRATTLPPVMSYWGGSGDDEIRSMTSLFNTRLLIAGTTSSSDLPIRNATQSAYGGGASDVFLAQLNADLSSLLSSTFLGAGGADSLVALSVQPGIVTLLGTTASDNLPTRGSGQMAYGGGSSDAFVAEFRLDQAREDLPILSTQYLGGSGTDTAFAAAGTVLGINSDSPQGVWRGPTPLRAPGGADGYLFALSDRRILGPATDQYVGKDQTLDISIRLGGATPIQDGIPLTITSSDPARLQVSFAIDSREAGAEDRFTARVRDITFSVRALADSGEATVTIRAEGYADSVLRVRLVPVQWYWQRVTGEVISSFSLPVPLATQFSTFSEAVSLREGFQIPGNTFVTYPGRSPRFPSASFRFRSADPNAVSVSANSPFGTNSVSFSRVGPGDTQIIAEAEGASVPPLTITTIDRPTSPTGSTAAVTPTNLPRGVLTSVSFQQFNSNDRTRIRVANPSLARIYDPFLNELVDEMELSFNSVELVASADEGVTELLATNNGQVTGTIPLNLIPAQLYLQTGASSSPLRSQTISLQSRDQTLFVGTNFFGFNRLWNVDSLSLEAVSSDPSVIELSSSRLTWTRSGNSPGNFAGAIIAQIRGLGRAELSLRVLEGPPGLRTLPFRFLVEDSSIQISGAATVGKNLRSLLTISSSGTIPQGTVFTIESADPTRLRVESRTVTMSGFNAPVFRVVGLADQGTVALTVSAPGYATLNTSIGLAPSAILFASPEFGSFLPADSSPQLRRTVLFVGSTSQVSIAGFALNSNGEPTLRQDPAIIVEARITNENPDVVRAGSSVVLPGNSTLSFELLKESRARLTIDAGPEWSQSSLGNALDIEVGRPSFFLNANAVVPRDAQVAYILPQNATGRWTVRSTDPSRLLVSASETAVGSESATVDGAGTPRVFLQAVAGSGNVRLQVFNPDVVVAGTATATLRETAARLSWTTSSSDSFPSNPATPQLTLSLNSPPSSLGLALVPQLPPGEAFNFGQEFPLRPGVEYRIPIQVKNPEVAVLTGDSIVIRSGAPAQRVNLRALAVGRTEIQVGIPPQLAPPGTLTTLPVLVEGPVLRLPANIVVGKDLVRQASVQFANVESQGNLRLNIESSDPSRVLLSTAQDQPGQASISFTTRAGTATNFFVHALAGEGTAAIQARADGYGDATGQVHLRQIGLQFLGLSNPSNLMTFALIQGAIPFEASLSTRVLALPIDGLSSSQDLGSRLRPGANLEVSLSSSDPGVVEVLNPKPDLSSGSARLQLRALRPGTAELTVDAGDIPVTGSRRIRVTGRQFGSNDSGLLTGRQIQRMLNFSGGDDVNVTITSSDPNRFLVSASPGQVGNASAIILPRQPRVYYIQGVSEGAAQITLSAPGFENRTLPVTVGSPGIRWTQFAQTTVYGLGDEVPRSVELTVSVGNSQPDNGFNRYWPSPNVELTLNLINSNAGLLNTPATLVLRGYAPPDIFNGISGGSNPNSPEVRLRAVGVATGRATVALSAPPGWAISGPPLTVEILPPQIRWFESSSPNPLGQNTVRALGYDLVGPSAQNRANIRLEFTSSNPALLRLSNRQDVPGVNALSDQPAGSQIFLHGIGGSGTANVLARWVLPGGLGFSQAPLSIPLTESIWRFAQTELNTQRGVDTAVNLGLYLVPAQGSSSSQMFMPGQTVTLNFSSSDPTVGTLRPTQLVISAPASSGNVFFNGLRAGETTLSIGPVAGFASDPARQSVHVKVN